MSYSDGGTGEAMDEVAGDALYKVVPPTVVITPGAHGVAEPMTPTTTLFMVGAVRTPRSPGRSPSTEASRNMGGHQGVTVASPGLDQWGKTPVAGGSM